MIKKELYPKTLRIKEDGARVQITEKLDGSNLIIFKLNEKLYIAQRKTILSIDEIEEYQSGMYKGLYQWLKDNEIELNDIHEGSAICGEWLGMGQIKYNVDEFDKRFYMFAKANVYYENQELCINNFMYDHDLFIYPFISQIIPKCIAIVPVVADIQVIPNKAHLDSLYAKYCEKVNRPVEGFVINYNNIISKYVRMKSGKLVEYSENDHKGVE